MENISILILTLVASTGGTITGFGTSTILVPVFSLQYPLVETLLFVGIVHWFGDIWKMLFFKRGRNWKLIILFGFTGVIVSYIGARLVGMYPEKLLEKLMGGFLILYVMFIWIHPRWKLPKSNANTLIGGGLSGFFSGFFGVGGVISSTFLSAYNLNKSVFLFTSGAIGFLIDSARLIGYFSGGVTLTNYSIPTLIAAIVISFLGAYIAKLIVNRIPQDKVRLLITFALFAVGIFYLVF